MAVVFRHQQRQAIVHMDICTLAKQLLDHLDKAVRRGFQQRDIFIGPGVEQSAHRIGVASQRRTPQRPVHLIVDIRPGVQQRLDAFGIAITRLPAQRPVYLCRDTFVPHVAPPHLISSSILKRLF